MFIEFVNQNIWWFLALAVVANLLVWSIVQGSAPGANMVSPLQMPALQRKGKSLILDVNKAADFEREHIPNAVNMPLESLDTKAKELDKFKDNAIIISCQTGSRSVKAARELVKAGFSNVNVLRGGLIAWNKENLPLSSGK